jgi:hypothetical protein
VNTAPRSLYRCPGPYVDRSRKEQAGKAPLALRKTTNPRCLEPVLDPDWKGLLSASVAGMGIVGELIRYVGSLAIHRTSVELILGEYCASARLGGIHSNGGRLRFTTAVQLCGPFESRSSTSSERPRLRRMHILLGVEPVSKYPPAVAIVRGVSDSEAC